VDIVKLPIEVKPAKWPLRRTEKIASGGAGIAAGRARKRPGLPMRYPRKTSNFYAFFTCAIWAKQFNSAKSNDYLNYTTTINHEQEGHRYYGKSNLEITVGHRNR
jgi:hypothetical protein